MLGFCNMVWKLIQDARNTDVGVVPTHFAVIFDYSAKTFRNELYPEYKANRSAPPEDLIPQFGLIREATRAFDLPCIEMEGFEADDMIATYARLACEVGADTTIVSSDKDLMQLVGPTVAMYDPMKDRQIGVPEVIEKWGVPPEKMIDLQALTGDSVDNVPGVPGIGAEDGGAAARAVRRPRHAARRAPPRSSRTSGGRRSSTMPTRRSISRELVRLKNDVPVAEGLDDLVLQPPNGPKLIAFLKTMEFTTLTRRVAEATGTDLAGVEAADGRRSTRPTCTGRMSGRGSAPVVPGRCGTQTSAASPAAPAASGRRDRQRERMRLRRSPQPAPRPQPPSKIDINAYHCIRDLQTLADWVAEAQRDRPAWRSTRADHFVRSDAGRPRRLLAGDRLPAAPPMCRSPTEPAPATCSAAGRPRARSRSAPRWPC